MPGHPAEKLVTVEEFLEHEGEPDVRYELVNGRIVAMAPPSVELGAIVDNLVTLLRTKLALPSCTYARAGLRLPNRDDTLLVADIAVSSNPDAGDDRWTTNPTLVVEVLSPETRIYKLGTKVFEITDSPTVQEILFVDSQSRWVQLWSRQAEGWFVRDHIGDALVPLETVPGGLSLDDIYEGV